jgi:hypothetical protein
MGMAVLSRIRIMEHDDVFGYSRVALHIPVSSSVLAAATLVTLRRVYTPASQHHVKPVLLALPMGFKCMCRSRRVHPLHRCRNQES